MSAGLPLRPYQRDAIGGVYGAWGRGVRRPVVVLPTGGGKTVTFSHIIRDALAGGIPGGVRRPLVLVHREELATQAADKLRQVSPGLDVGIVKAERDEVDADVVVASVQTLSRPARLARLFEADRSVTGTMPRRLVVVDEAHHAAAATWTQLLADLGCFTTADVDRAYALAVGFTATLSREDGRGLGDVWEEAVTPADVLDGIAGGWLVDPRGKAVTVDGLSLADVARTRGDYQDGALGDALIGSGAGVTIAAAYREHATRPDGTLRSGVLFAPTVASAAAIAGDFRAAGITVGEVYGTTPPEERRRLFEAHRTGAVTVLVNAMVLTEGWDAPWCEVAVVARPTRSAGLYQQMVGRVLRPFPGKPDALVLDVVGVSAEHSLARSLVDLTPSVTEVRDGETLAEAVRREAVERKTRPARGTALAGIVAAADVDLFHRSASVWLRTYAGTWFVPTTDWTYFIWPDETGRWRVGRKATWRNRSGDRGGWMVQDPEGTVWTGDSAEADRWEMDAAMAWGEAAAAEEDPSISRRTASWRRPSNRASDAQQGLLVRYGLVADGEDVTAVKRADASDRISVHLASRDLDPRGSTTTRRA